MSHKIYKIKENERLPVGFWEDHTWALTHYADLCKKYPDMWVVIANKKVVASGKDLTNKTKESIRIKIGRPVVKLYLESHVRIL